MTKNGGLYFGVFPSVFIDKILVIFAEFLNIHQYTTMDFCGYEGISRKNMVME